MQTYLFAGACCAGAAAGGGGTGVLDCGMAAPSKMLFLLSAPQMVRSTEVTMNTAARPLVKRVKKFAPPAEPNTVWLEPPKEALISAPFPDCKSTTTIKSTQQRI